MAAYDRSAALYDAIYRGVGKDYGAEASTIIDLVRANHVQARTLLDVACGTGGHLEHLSRAFAAEGLERSRHMASLARAKLPGVTVHEGDMRAFDLGRRFDVVTSLFSSIGYMLTVEDLARAVAAMAAHLAPGGLLVVEPWFNPEQWIDGHVVANSATEPGLAVARVSLSHRRGRVSTLDFHYTVATAAGVDRFHERHDLGLFSRGEYEAAFAAAGCSATYEEPGLTGRGLYLARR